jgi:ferritin
MKLKNYTMLSKKVEDTLNKQIKIEGESSQIYLAMACWAEFKGLEGVSNFMYEQSNEEREHMLKLVKFVNERGGHAKISELQEPNKTFNSFQEMFEKLLKHELFVSQSINELVHITLEEKDYATHNFLQWYVSEQIEEEAVARSILDKINLIGDDKGGLYLFDRDIKTLTVTTVALPSSEK